MKRWWSVPVPAENEHQHVVLASDFDAMERRAVEAERKLAADEATNEPYYKLKIRAERAEACATEASRTILRLEAEREELKDAVDELRGERDKVTQERDQRERTAHSQLTVTAALNRENLIVSAERDRYKAMVEKIRAVVHAPTS